MASTNLTYRKYRRDARRYANQSIDTEWAVFERHMSLPIASAAMLGRRLAGSSVSVAGWSGQ